MATYIAMLELLKKCPCILSGPHAGTRSRCGVSKGLDEFAEDPEKDYPGQNAESVVGCRQVNNLVTVRGPEDATCRDVRKRIRDAAALCVMHTEFVTGISCP